VFIYDDSFNLINQASVGGGFITEFNSALIEGENLYIGSKDFGVLNSITTNPNEFVEIRPDGPLLNNLFSITYSNDDLWGVSGGYNLFYNFIGGDRVRTGISRLKNNEWSNIPFDTISNAIVNPYYLSHIAINPIEPNQVFVSSYYSGLIEFDDEEILGLYNQDNSTLTPFYGNWKLTGASTYDSEGVLWVMNGRVDSPLNKFKNGSWTSFSFSEIISDPINELGFSNIAIDNSGVKYMGTYGFGVIAFDENGGSPLLTNISEESENMPDKFVTSVAIDNRNQLWIGTYRGLRVLYNPSSIFTDENLSVSEIIIEEDGIAKELLFQQLITDIEVDGSNNKWIGTSDSGLFYLSSDGQNTIFHFTKDNSPLPSNSINDVALDIVNGIVYIATTKGLLSFNSGGSSAFEDLESAYAYPNPIRPGFNIVDDKVKIKDISENVNIKITDIEGNLVAEAQSRINQRYQGYNLEIDGGTAYWNGKNLANNVVASGVYLVMLSDLDTFETKVLKLMVVR
ncbi:two-component regulator propeller domain-containing protein, partial [Algibacter sp.]|uniref:type IX secretion system anionic LPS delivery protein PorZ n=1 Tax=Algibacter sp. TaxID=1872428 RepID=UPI003C74B5A3